MGWSGTVALGVLTASTCGWLPTATWAQARDSTPVIYRCEILGVTTFSDRPCDSSATTYQPDSSRISTYDPPAISAADPGSRQAQPHKRRAQARHSAVAAQAKRAAACARVRQSLKELRTRMRTGYSAKQGERLKERKAELERRWRVDRCR